MFGASIYAARIYNAALYTAPAAAPHAPTPTGGRGRRLVRWLIEMPIIENPLGQWIRQREDEEELFIL